MRDSKSFIFSLSFSPYLTLCISHYLAIASTHWIKRECKRFQLCTHTHRDTQHHDAAIWSHVSLSVKWSLLFRYCAASALICCVIVCGWMCVRIRVAPSLSTCWTGSTNYTYYCQKVSVKQGISYKLRRMNEKERAKNHKFSWFFKESTVQSNEDDRSISFTNLWENFR